MQRTEPRRVAEPEELAGLPHRAAEIVAVADRQVGRLVLQPSWRRSHPLVVSDCCPDSDGAP